ncbi:MAG: IS1595 family transposase [Candidatus Tectomicrobia bacterium]
MEHRKFINLLNELSDELTATQAEKLIVALHAGSGEDAVCALIEQSAREDLSCPHCEGTHLQHWGKSHGLQRYRCMSCAKTFNALTGTPLARLQHKDLWLTFAHALQHSHSVRRAAQDCGIANATSFHWRHRFLAAQKHAKARRLEGIVEVDETFILKSAKGQRGLARSPRKRGGKAKKPGLSKEHVPVLIARDRSGAMVDAVLPDRSEKAIHQVLERVVSKDALLCMDGDKALIAFARSQGIEYEPVIVSRGERVCEGVLHVQNVNAYVSRLKGWMKPFNGVATKYLQNYLGWRRLLESQGHAITPEFCLSAALG